MVNIIAVIASLIMLSITLFSLIFVISCINEKESRASFFAGIQFIVFGIIFIAIQYLRTTGFFDTGIGTIVLLVGFALIVIALLMLLLPIGASPKALKGTKELITGDVKRFDERDTLFSKLTKQLMDSDSTDTLSIMPEMGSIDGAGGVHNVEMGETSLNFTRSLATPDRLNPKVLAGKIEMTPEEASLRIKDYAKNLGSCMTGIAEINPLWFYSHYGRSGIATNEWGKEITVNYKYAIVFAQEMNVDMINTAPHTPALLESLQNYAKGAYIATQVASYIASIGYPAKVNQMAHYDAMMVPLAVDAGLGELSRMGYLITKEYGPRVRLSAVLTDLPLVPDTPVDIGVVDFCSKCKKCAHNCPSDAISFDDRIEENGTLRWIINRDACFGYWQNIGTDCCICMSVCPWSHARTFPHRVITNFVSRNSISRTLFTCMDDLFYGKSPY